jgi:hypothetical protein
MTRRLFVCHATADIEATSELVDALENALSFSTGSLWTSGLPGYSADPNDMPALGAALAGSDVVLALITQTSVQDAQFHFQLGAAWALGAHTVLFLLEPVADDALPNALNQATVMRGHEPSQWSELIGDLSVRLGLVPRPGASYAPAISPSSPPPAPKSAPPPPAAVPSASRIPAEAAALIAPAATGEPATGPRLQASATTPSASSASAATAGDTPVHASPAAADAATADLAAEQASAAAPSASAAHDTRTDAAAPAAPSTAPAAQADAATADAPTTPAKRADDTPLPAALAQIANASARSPGATTALQAASAQISAAKAQTQQPTAAAPPKTVSVPPLPGAPVARPIQVPPLPTAPTAPNAGQTRKVGVPPLPAAVSTNSVIVPPPPAGAHPDFDDSAEPTTTPKAPIIILTSIPEPEPEPESYPSAPAKADTKPQPRAAGAYPSVAPQQSYLDELRAIDPAERTPPRYSYVDELETLDSEADAAAASGYEALPSDDDDEPDTREQLRVPTRDGLLAADAEEGEPDSDSDVFARLPTCEMALEAGRAVSDCLFNRDEISNFAADLDGPLGGLIECLGASWTELRDEQDLDTWVAVTDHLLQTLPEEVRKLEEWYRVGFELAILHNLAAQLVLDGSDPAAEQHWRGALERFLMRAERAEIGYENLGRVLGLLENLAGPSHERDLTNISRSLEELRRYAAGADIHTAA